MRYDFVIVGGGTAGCVVAARLTEDPSVKVLLLEAGRERHNPLLSVPLGEVLLLGNPKYDWCFETEPDPTIGNRRLRMPRGRLLGGSNAINGMLFVRGQPEDYDDWEGRGNKGWSWSDVLPYFEGLERTQFGTNGRGRAGPMAVNLPTERDALCDAFIAAAGSAGYRSNADYNSGDQEGFGYYQVTHESGRRASVLSTYLKEARHRRNLKILTGALATKLRFQGVRCVGVRYRRNGAEENIDCSREVLVCAGAIQSPLLLELSGIGCAGVLANAGVSLRHHLPGVGENLRDHFAVRMRWRIRMPVTMNERLRGAALIREIARYALHRQGALSQPIALVFGFVRSTPREPRPDVQFHIAPASYEQGSRRRLDSRPGMTVGIYPLRPESKGSVHIRSPDPVEGPAICSRFLESESDRGRLLAGIRIARRIVRQPTFSPFCGAELSPGLELQSDEELLDNARIRGDTSYHPVGTCGMGADEMAVVDQRLRVRGLRGIRVIDASVMPSMVSGNTNAATLMIAERGAAMIREDHGPGRGRGLADPGAKKPELAPVLSATGKRPQGSR